MLKRFECYKPMNISLIFIGLMFSVPFISMHHLQPLPAFFSEWLAGICGLIATLPLLFSADGKALKAPADSTLPTHSHFKIPQTSLIFVGLGAILCVQWLLGMLHSPQFALSVLSYFIWAFLLVVLGSKLKKEFGLEKLSVTLSWCLIGACIINIGIVVLQFVARTGGVISFLPDLPSFGALSQTNHFGNFCALAITSLIYLHAKGRFSFSFFNLILVLFMMMLSFSGSRSAWLYLIALTILVVIMQRLNVKQGTESHATKLAWRAGLLLLPIFIVVQLFIYFVIPNELIKLPTERLFDGLSANTASARLRFWYDSWRIFLQSPWLGVGAGQLISNTFMLIDTPTTMSSNRVFENSHNMFLHILAEMGMAGFFIVLFGLFGWAKAFEWRALNLETCWIAGLLSILSIHSLLEYPLWFTFFLGIAAVLLGVGDKKFISIKASKFSLKFARLSLVIVCLFGSYHLATSLIANAKLESWLKKFGYENINDIAQLDWVQQNSLLSPYSGLMLARALTIDPKLIDGQFLLNKSAMNFRPYRTIAYQHALLLELKGQHEDAVKQLDRTIKAYPDTFKSFLENPELKFRQTYLNLYAETQTARLNKKN